MFPRYIAYYATAALLFFSACSSKKPNPKLADAITTKPGQPVNLPAPYETKSVHNYCRLIGWPKGKTPVAPPGFKVTLFADSLENPRNIYLGSNGDIFVSEATTEIDGIKKIEADVAGASASENLGKSPNKIILFRDTNGDGVPDLKTVFLSGLNQPFGMLILGDWFFVANTNGLWRYPYKTGQTSIAGGGKMILELPMGSYNRHWVRNLRTNPAGDKIFIAVGSGSNDGEHGMADEKRRADILEINPDGTGEKIYASGLRNPTGIAFHPQTHVLYTAVNERDELGDDLVPDYFTSVKEGGFYGWPYAYFGQHEDPNNKGKAPGLVKKTITPDFALGSHTASLGLAFYTGKSFPQKYWDGAFIGQHGSWNRSVLAGYKVVFIPFENGKPGKVMEDFLTGFIANLEKKEVYGRPVSIVVLKDGSVLVADDAGNRIWRVSRE